MRPTTVHLGYAVGDGAPVEIPLGHLVVFGQTQMAGKTTALEAIVSRADVRAVAFVTKRGEGGFAAAREIQPYFRERADWQFVQSVLEATLTQKQDYKQAWIMRACEGAATLEQVQRNTQRLMQESKNSLSRDMYYVLGAYFELVIPQIHRLPKTDRVELAAGVNVMNLEGYTPELQALVIRSVIEWVHRHESGVVTVIPEAWRFLPQGRRSPVKMAAEELIREGAGLRNFVFIDSQDIAGVDKLPLRAAKVWLIGVQRETNEISRNLDNMQAGLRKPRAADVAMLGLGQFYVAHGHELIKAYVQPAWMSEADARAIARGELDVDRAHRRTAPVAVLNRRSARQLAAKRQSLASERQHQPPAEDDEMSKQDVDRLEKGLATLTQQVGKLAESLAHRPAAGAAAPARSADGRREYSAGESMDHEQLYQAIKARLSEEAPALLKVVTIKPELEVNVVHATIEADGKSLIGRIGYLIASGWFKEPRSQSAIRSELKRTGPDVNSGNLSTAVAKLVSLGFLTNESEGYVEVKGMKARIVEKK